MVSVVPLPSQHLYDQARVSQLPAPPNDLNRDVATRVCVLGCAGSRGSGMGRASCASCGASCSGNCCSGAQGWRLGCPHLVMLLV